MSKQELTIIILMLFPLLLLLTLSCGSENVVNEPCKDEPVLIGTNLTDSLTNQLNCSLKKGIEEDEVKIIVKTQNELNEWLTCDNSLPDIDLSKKFLIGGRAKSYDCGYLEDLAVSTKCDTVYVEAVVHPTIFGCISDVYFLSVVPRMYSENQIIFNIKYSEL